MEVAGKQITIIGMAKSGLAAAEFLAARGARVLVSDVKPAESLQHEMASLRALGIEVETGGHSHNTLMNADLIVVSPGVPLEIEPLRTAHAAGKKLIGEVELAAAFLQGTLVGITGSNGKTTTTTLIGKLLADAGFYTQVGGNIGTPLISLAAASQPDGCTVIELSSFQLEATEQLHINVAVLLNITPDHMDRYRSFDDYAAAKQRIFLKQQASDFAILNADDALVKSMAATTPANKIFFSRLTSLSEGIFLRGDLVIYRNQSGEEHELLNAQQDIRLRGAHNLENVMAGLAAGIAVKANFESMRRTIREFQGVEHRLEWVAEINGVQFFNDSKATNVDAAIKALEAFPKNLILILGGKDKGSDYTPLRPLVGTRVKQVILIGAASDKIAAALDGVTQLRRATTMHDAVVESFAAALPGDVVLLAPACASFDMFDNFEHRGRVFKEEVKQLQVQKG
ncbi:MAG: UDP-N-acetylmuramoyl-L-alanine--D-glutamate ligase [Acidobacteriota bacterium]